MLAPPPVELPADPAADLDPAAPATALAHPDSPLVWATRAENAIDSASSDDDKLVAYAYARTGYHRSLDRLRANKWKGWGPVPWSHAPNQGYLRSVRALGAAAAHVGETDEVARLADLLHDGDPSL